MKKGTIKLLDQFFIDNPDMSLIEDKIVLAIEEMVKRIKQGGKILVCGNGGSGADAEHIVGELMKNFYYDRGVDQEFLKKIEENMTEEEGKLFASSLQRVIPAISLVSQTGLITAYNNDVDSSMVFAQQVYGYGNDKDILIGISTSGNADNVYKAARTANLKDMLVISLTGLEGGRLKDVSTINLNVNERETYRVQEKHLPLYHLLCMTLEYEMFGA